MNIERNNLINGIQRGFERTSVHFGVPLKGQREEIESDLRRVFEAWPGGNTSEIRSVIRRNGDSCCGGETSI